MIVLLLSFSLSYKDYFNYPFDCEQKFTDSLKKIVVLKVLLVTLFHGLMVVVLTGYTDRNNRDHGGGGAGHFFLGLIF